MKSLIQNVPFKTIYIFFRTVLPFFIFLKFLNMSFQNFLYILILRISPSFIVLSTPNKTKKSCSLVILYTTEKILQYIYGLLY